MRRNVIKPHKGGSNFCLFENSVNLIKAISLMIRVRYLNFVVGLVRGFLKIRNQPKSKGRGFLHKIVLYLRSLVVVG